MQNKTPSLQDDWPSQTSYLIGHSAEDTLPPLDMPRDGRNLPDADLDALAEAMFASLSKAIGDAER